MTLELSTESGRAPLHLAYRHLARAVAGLACLAMAPTAGDCAALRNQVRADLLTADSQLRGRRPDSAAGRVLVRATGTAIALADHEAASARSGRAAAHAWPVHRLRRVVRDLRATERLLHAELSGTPGAGRPEPQCHHGRAASPHDPASIHENLEIR